MSFLINLFSATAVALLLANPTQAETISPWDTLRHIGKEMTVEGVVSQVSTSNGGTTFINFGGRFPNHIFYAVIFRNSASQFPGVQKLRGETVAITGVVRLHKGKPQVILSEPDQLVLR